VRLVPAQRRLLVQFVEAPAVDLALSTAYPARLPHARTKLQQLDTIEGMLQETLKGGCTATSACPGGCGCDAWPCKDDG
jgi:hypothetical protein